MHVRMRMHVVAVRRTRIVFPTSLTPQQLLQRKDKAVEFEACNGERGDELAEVFCMQRCKVS